MLPLRSKMPGNVYPPVDRNNPPQGSFSWKKEVSLALLSGLIGYEKNQRPLHNADVLLSNLKLQSCSYHLFQNIDELCNVRIL